MTDKNMLARSGGSKNIQEIVEKIESIVNIADEFREEVNSVYDKSDLAFLKRISKSLGELEAASDKVIQSFVEVEETLETYNKEQDEDFSKQYCLRGA